MLQWVYLYSNDVIVIIMFICSWTGVFKDPESGMAHYKWAVGSRPGYDNIYTFEETYDTCSETKHDYSLTPEEGHSYFVTVMVLMHYNCNIAHIHNGLQNHTRSSQNGKHL